MKRFIIPFLFTLLFANHALAQGYEVGEKAADFKLKNTDGKMVSMKDYQDAKGFVIVFMDNRCPTSKEYEDLIIKLDTKYKGAGFPFIGINPSDPEVYPKESFGHMVTRAEKKGFTFPYLVDADQEVMRAYRPIFIPQAYLLEKVGQEFFVRYIGAIDIINQTGRKDKKLHYLSNAIDALLEGNKPDPNYYKSGGCRIDYTVE